MMVILLVYHAGMRNCTINLVYFAGNTQRWDFVGSPVVKSLTDQTVSSIFSRLDFSDLSTLCIFSKISLAKHLLCLINRNHFHALFFLNLKKKYQHIFMYFIIEFYENKHFDYSKIDMLTFDCQML